MIVDKGNDVSGKALYGPQLRKYEKVRTEFRTSYLLLVI